MKPSLASDQARIRWIGNWLPLAVALVWAIVIRIPLILNVETHLDSDLAVDGLTLRDAVDGHWRWHYPGTPHMGILPVLLSFPQALVWGANPFTLVSAGTVAYVGLIAATFVLARRTFGSAVASWSLIPLTFASTGAIWLSGRVTGGHLAAAAWHAGAFALLHENLVRGRRREAIALGLWCGIGVYLDSLFLVTLAGLIPAAVIAWWAAGRSRSGVISALIFLPCLLAGASPREIGARIDPHDAYREQFLPVFRRDVLEEHARILFLDCVPRLIVGHRIPGFQADPDPTALSGPGPSATKGDSSPFAVAGTMVGLALFVLAMGTLVVSSPGERGGAARAIRLGLILSAIVTVAGFLVNRNIFNSDNYRYLVGLLVPWSLGFGLAMRSLTRRGSGGRAVAGILALSFSLLMTVDVARWYTRFGWVDERGRPTRVAFHDPALDWLGDHGEVREVFGGYWDVYRLSFLSRRPLRGIPFPIYPNRFPEWSSSPGGGHPRIMIVRPSPEGNPFLAQALRDGGRIVHRARGVLIVSWP